MPVRIYDIAKKLGIESKEVLAKAKELGIAAKVPSSSLDKITAEYLESHFAPLKPAEPEPTLAPPTQAVSAPPPLHETPAESGADAKPPTQEVASPAGPISVVTIAPPASVAPVPVELKPAPPPEPLPPPGPKVGDKIGFIQLPTRPAARSAERGAGPGMRAPQRGTTPAPSPPARGRGDSTRLMRGTPQSPGRGVTPAAPARPASPSKPAAPVIVLPEDAQVITQAAHHRARPR